MRANLQLSGVGKSFTMHLRGGIVLPVVSDINFTVSDGTCAVLGGPSGAGKSSILKMIYGNYRCDQGQILVRYSEVETPNDDQTDSVDIARAEPRTILTVRKQIIAYVSQFLRVIPRVPALEIVAEPLLERGVARDEAVDRARELLVLLNVPQKLWALPPATFSGGEQQRVNIARGFIADYPVLLLDEPTASLDAANRSVVVDLIHRKKQAGVALLGIFHDADVRDAVADQVIDVTAFSAIPDAA